MRRLLLFALLCLALCSHAAEGVVRGVVRTADGSPMPYAYVSVNGKPYATQADKEGAYKLSLPDGTYTLTARLRGYREHAQQLEVRGEQSLDFVLEEDLIDLGAVTVTGTRTPRLLSETPVVTQIITRDDIRQLDATNLRDVLQQEMPGLEFTLQMDQQTALRLQGLGGMSLLILVDGQRLAGETLDNTDFLRLTTDNIERIEITKGAASALYGSNSVGAVINIITRQAPQGWTANASTHFASHNEQRHGATLGIAKGMVNSLTSLLYNAIDSYNINDREGDASTLIYGNTQWNLKEKLTLTPAEGNTLTAQAGYYFHQRDYSDYKDNRARDFSGSLNWQRDLPQGSSLSLAYVFDRYDKSDYYTQLHKDFLTYKNTQNSLRALYTLPLPHGFTLTTGADALADRLLTYQFDGEAHTQANADLFAQAEWRPNAHFDILAGLRGDWTSHSHLTLSPKLTAMYSLSALRLRASYSRGFRTPTLKERYMDFDMSGIFTIHGNTSLSNEYSHSFSLSAEYTHSRYSFAATAYLNLMRNEIATLWDSSRPTDVSPAGSMVYQNVDDRTLTGIDLTLLARYPCGIGLKLAYAYFHEFPSNTAGLNWSDSRPHSLTAKADYRRTFRNLDLDVTLSGRALSHASFYTYSDDYSRRDAPASAPAYTIWRVTLSQTIRRAYTLTLAADNIFNYRPPVFTYSSPVTTGATFSATLSLDIDQVFTRR